MIQKKKLIILIISLMVITSIIFGLLLNLNYKQGLKNIPSKIIINLNNKEITFFNKTNEFEQILYLNNSRFNEHSLNIYTDNTYYNQNSNYIEYIYKDKNEIIINNQSIKFNKIRFFINENIHFFILIDGTNEYYAQNIDYSYNLEEFIKELK